MFSNMENCGYKIYNNPCITPVFLSKDSYNYQYGDRLVTSAENIIFTNLIYLYGLLNNNFPIYHEYKMWIGMEKGPNIEPYAIIYDKKKNICVSDNFIFSSIDGLVSDQIKEVKKAYNDLLTTINNHNLSDILKTKLIIDYEDRYNKKPKVNEEYDKVTLPYKYFSEKWICLRLILDTNKLNEVYSGFFRLCGNNELVRDNELNSICPLYVYE